MRTLAIVGPGLIGRSVGLAARRRFADVDIVEIDAGDALEAASNADLIVLAAPVDAILDLLRTSSRFLQRRTVVDTGSTKRQIGEAARASGLSHFVGGHPMAGAATSGPGGARADLFDGAPWFLVPNGAAADAVERVTTFVASLGAQPVVMDDDGSLHDEVMAAVSHLPQVVASVLMTVAADAAAARLSWAGPGLRDTTRLAESAGSVWAGVLATNATALAPLLRRVAGELVAVAERLDDPARVRALFERARADRQRLQAAGEDAASDVLTSARGAPPPTPA